MFFDPVVLFFKDAEISGIVRQAIQVKRAHTGLGLNPPGFLTVLGGLIESAVEEETTLFLVKAIFQRVIEQCPIKVKQRII